MGTVIRFAPRVRHISASVPASGGAADGRFRRMLEASDGPDVLDVPDGVVPGRAHILTDDFPERVVARCPGAAAYLRQLAEMLRLNATVEREGKALFSCLVQRVPNEVGVRVIAALLCEALPGQVVPRLDADGLPRSTVALVFGNPQTGKAGLLANFLRAPGLRGLIVENFRGLDDHPDVMEVLRGMLMDGRYRDLGTGEEIDVGGRFILCATLPAAPGLAADNTGADSSDADDSDDTRHIDP